MLHSHWRRIRAFILGVALILPLGALAQQPPAAGGKAPEAAPAAAAPAAAAPAQASPPPTPAPGSTAVPGWNVPPKWEQVEGKAAYASVRGRETDVLIQAAGHEWRKFRNGPVTQLGGWLLVGVLSLFVLFYLVRGPIKVHGAPTGRLIERFNGVERVAHWTMGISFVVLALTGIVILFGKHIILPWLGHAGFSWITVVSKNLHNFVGPLFIFSLVVFILIYAKDNLWASHDFGWLSNMGGMLSKSGPHTPSGRFNAGEKLWFWGGVVVLGVVVSVTGLILDFPNWNQGREAMQQANVIHAIAAVLFMAGSVLHIYMGTVGLEGAYQAMREGYVDETWAKEHHEYWYEDVKSGKRREKVVAGAPQPATGD
jgi:formate dehydrogenase subunit gamma